MASTVGRMPEISRFLGIVIQMYYTVQTGLVRGSFPPRALQHVRDWAQLHQAELLANWERARKGRPLEPIDPLE